MGRLIIVSALALALAQAPGAAAHGGAVIGSAKNDAYALSVAASDIELADGRPAVDVTAYPIRRASGSPELDARLTVTFDGRTYEGQRLGDGIDVEIPIERAGSWREYPLEIAVAGDAGAISLAVEPLATDGGGPPGWLYPLTALAGAVIVGWSIRRIRAKRRSQPAELPS